MYRKLLEELKRLTEQRVRLEHLSYNSFKYIISIDDVESVLPCKDMKPVVNEAKIRDFRPLRVKLGELTEIILPIDIFTDYVSKNTQGSKYCSSDKALRTGSYFRVSMC